MSAAAKTGPGPAQIGSAEFTRLTDPFRAELLAHCYRMLGSVHDAEDQVQETLLRAWRSFGQFEGRSSLRTWLYRIATNACLRAIETRGRRPLPSGLGAPGEHPEGPLAAATPEVPWLQPIPDALLRPESADPAAVAASRTNVRLAFIAALQYLPPRQRAVLILRDVLDWRAAEVAELLGTTATATNSALQRARAQLEQAAPSQDEIREPANPGDLALLNRYATAFQNADIAALTELLHDDAVLEMPPMPAWFAGREHVGLFLRTHLLRQPGEFTMIPTAANGQPALAAYRRGRDGVYRANGIEMLTVTGSRIARIVVFLDAGVFASFGLAQELPLPMSES
jgi:RNA polymerase sigma-70 factor (ECF subfamily)